jgi:hypothetical protein
MLVCRAVGAKANVLQSVGFVRLVASSFDFAEALAFCLSFFCSFILGRVGLLG